MTSMKHLTLFFLGLAVYCISAAPATDTTHQQAEYLKQLGYLEEIPTSRSGAADPEFKQAVKDFQRYAGLPETGVVDKATKDKMAAPRCGFPDNRYDARTAWGHKDLTYRIDTYPSREVSRQETDETVALAFKYWSDKSSLTFERKYGQELVDIVIFFASGAHGDGGAFDGSSGVLAHAYFPHPGTQTVDGLWGDAHFDDAERWTINVYSGINLLQVAVHEFGHSLGLGHSRDRDAIMYAYYRGYVPNMQLHSDDVAGIRHLYGAGEGTVAPPVTTTRTSTSTTTTMMPTPSDSPSPSPSPSPSMPPTSPPSECINGYYLYPFSRRMGGKRKAAGRTEDRCKGFCDDNAKCWGYTFESEKTPKFRCYVYELSTYSSSSYNYYFKDVNGGYTETANTSHRGGLRYFDFLTQTDCELLCDFDFSCTGYSIQKNNNKRKVCRLHIYSILPTGVETHNHYQKCE